MLNEAGFEDKTADCGLGFDAEEVVSKSGILFGRGVEPDAVDIDFSVCGGFDLATIVTYGEPVARV